ncbi:MAG: molybdenum cofactor biosynthesis protein MoaE [Candidatus Bathyarchaeota archaeon]|nr:MAG: molybdenum cofactor biosynthesis protein MoaE [Candidatus Bathyarchaeota archaeon]
MVKHTSIHDKGELSLFDVLESVRNDPNFPESGAIGVFVGVVRGKTTKDEVVRKLRLEAYEEKANKVLEDICNELRRRTGIVDVQIHHFVGEFNVSEDLVYVAVAGAHRGDVFPVLTEAVERYKKEAPIWKKEYLESGKSSWVSEKH